MKKITIILLVLLMLCGCASSSAAPSPQGNNPSNQNNDFDAGKLSFEYFDELYAQLTYDGLPEDRTSIPLGNANGVWKYDLRIRRDSATDGSLFDELGYAEMYVHDSDDPPVKIVLHPRLANDGNEIREETDEEVGYEPFGGVFDENNVLKLTGNDCVLVLERYYEWKGKEYLTATLWLSEEESGTFMMIREMNASDTADSDYDPGNDTIRIEDLPEYPGSSSAFTSNPCEGVKVSAEEGAFMEDTVVSFTKLDELPEQFSELIEELTDQMILPIYAWEVDAGLEDDEVIPGAFKVEIDLEEIGIDPDYWSALSVARIGDDGSFYEYAATVDGSKLTFQSRQNSIITVLIAMAAVGKIKEHDHTIEYDYFWSLRKGKDFYIETKKITTAYGTYEIEWDMKEYAPEYSDKMKRIYQLEEEFNQSARDIVEILNPHDLNNNREIMRKYMELKNDNTEYWKLKEGIPLPDAIKETIKYINTAYNYLGGVQKVRMPLGRVVFQARADGNDPKYADKLGEAGKEQLITIVSLWPHKAMGSKQDKDNYLLTITHELFHVCQERYRLTPLSANLLTDDPRYDEMVTMVLERDAKDYYKSKQSGAITTDPGLTDKKQWYALRLPIDQDPKSEGGIKDSGDAKTLLMREGYLLGDFVMYLQEQFPKAKATPHELMKARSYFYQSAVSTPLRTVFGLTEAEFDTYFRRWVISREQTIMSLADIIVDETEYYRKDRTVISPGNSYHVTLANDGSYFLNLRGFKKEQNIELPGVLVFDQDFRKSHSSIVLLSLDNSDIPIKNGTYFKNLRKPVFAEVYGKIEPDEDMNVGYTLWTFGKTSSPPVVKQEQDELVIELPKTDGMAKAGIIDGYYLKVSYQGTMVFEDDISKNEFETTKKYKISEFMGSFPKDEKPDLIVTLCEYVKDTDGNRCMGIESDPVHTGDSEQNICKIKYVNKRNNATYYITVEGGVVYGQYEGFNWPYDERYVGVQVKPYEKIKITVESFDGSRIRVLPAGIEGEEGVWLQSGESREYVPRTKITEDDKYNYAVWLWFVAQVGDPNGEHMNWGLPYLKFNGVEEYTKTPLSYYEAIDTWNY